MLQFFDTLTDISGNSLLGGTVTVTNYPSGTLATIYSSNGTAAPIANSVVVADITGQVSFFVPDGAYTLTYAFKGTNYKVRSPVQLLDPMGFVFATDTGVANALVVAGAQYPATKYVGLKLQVLIAALNTGATTLNYQADGGQPVKFPGGAALSSGTFQPNGLYTVQWDGAEWQLLATPPNLPFYGQTTQEQAASAVPTNTSINPVPEDARRFGADPTGVADSRGAFNTLNSIGLPIVIQAGTYLINSNVTIGPSIRFEPGAILKPAAGVTVTLGGASNLNSTIVAGNYQIFDLSLGGVVIVPLRTSETWAEWWGARGDLVKTNNEFAFNSAWYALLTAGGGAFTYGGYIRFSRGDFYVSGTTYASDNISMKGDNSFYSLIVSHANWNAALSNMHQSQSAAYGFAGISGGSGGAVTFTAALAATATSATLSQNWPGSSGTYPMVFFESAGTGCEQRSVTLTNGLNTVSWAGGLTNPCTNYGVALGTVALFNQRLEQMRMSASDNLNITRLIYAPAWQQKCGTRNFYGASFTQYGIYQDQGYGGAAQLNIDETELFASPFAGPASYCIYMNLPAYSTGYLTLNCRTVQVGSFAAPVTFTAAPAATATSATLNANWPYPTGAWNVQFVETVGGAIESRLVTLTNGATTATWSNGLTNNCNAAASGFSPNVYGVVGNGRVIVNSSDIHGEGIFSVAQLIAGARLVGNSLKADGSPTVQNLLVCSGSWTGNVNIAAMEKGGAANFITDNSRGPYALANAFGTAGYGGSANGDPADRIIWPPDPRQCIGAGQWTIAAGVATLVYQTGVFFSGSVPTKQAAGQWRFTAGTPNTWDGVNNYDVLPSSNLPQNGVTKNSATNFDIFSSTAAGVATDPTTISVKVYHSA